MDFFHNFTRKGPIDGIGSVKHHVWTAVKTSKVVVLWDNEEWADEAFDITVTDWCIVIYDSELYPGEVQSQQGNGYVFYTMTNSGRYWKTPKNEDTTFYTRDNI